MSRIHLYIANAGKDFTDTDMIAIRRAVERAETFVSGVFRSFDYDLDLIVVSSSPTTPTIPQDGIGGRTYHSRLIVVALDKSQHEPSEDFIFETVCHELSHSLRWEKVPEFAETLFDSMVMEGLAVVLEEQAMNQSDYELRQFFLTEIRRTKLKEINTMIAVLNDKFDDTEYDYKTIFFSGNDLLPRWTGYKLGYYLVKRYLSKTKQTIERATLASYKELRRKSK
ncbi:DUF2268 domain-containing protein [Candidatus Saccharibacteria bacterium]|nr:DUF2268 domain-containing protein [Candidatus Saccharibacteria bacterium]